MVTFLRSLLFLSIFMLSLPLAAGNVKLRGSVTARGEGAVPYATVAVEGGTLGTYAGNDGCYELELPEGRYYLVVTAVGFETYRREIVVGDNHPVIYNVELVQSEILLDDVVIAESAGGVSRLRRSAYNVVALDTEEYLNASKNLGDILAKSPGVKLRESGGVGSDMNIMLDGFSGKHVKVFVDGVPQDGVGPSFGLNNIPVNYAKRIEVYRGVVPVQFGTDAMGGVVNIVTDKARQGWRLDASYSYGSFNTHSSFLNFCKVLKSGFSYELNFFQNYSDNDYTVDAPVEDFVTGSIEKKKLHRVERFNDTYHNEAAVLKAGVVDKPWADRMMLGLVYSQMYKEIQTGVRQEIVYGKKHRKGFSLMPSFEYLKRNLFADGLDLSLTANYNRNSTTNVDTASCKYNWRGEMNRLNTPGEQSLQHMRSDNDNWNATATIDYRPGRTHTHLFTVHYLFNAFRRTNSSLLLPQRAEDPIAKVTRKGVAGISYRLMPSDRWNMTLFAKHYSLYVSGPMATTGNADSYVRERRNLGMFGYGAAGTCHILPGLQAKVSYEKACRLPTIDEMFGDEDLEMGDVGIDPEKSHNVNLNISYSGKFGGHGLYVEGGVVYRDTRDYIQRNIVDLSGGKAAATYINYGKVLTKGYNITLRYTLDRFMSLGGNFTDMKVLDNMKSAIGSSVPNLGYGEEMPNLPSLFADFDVSLYWHGLWGKDNLLTLTYDGRYVKEFSYYSAKIGANKGDYMVPSQLSHNVTLSYAIGGGRYNVSLECRNITDERLYDNFSLQKAGRAFYAKVRVRLGK